MRPDRALAASQAQAEKRRLARIEEKKQARQRARGQHAQQPSSRQTRYYSPLVLATAQGLEVDLSGVRGTGVAGRVTPGDVRAAAGLPRGAAQSQPQSRPRLAAAPPSSGPSLRVTVQARWTQNVAHGAGYLNQQKTVQVDVFGRNPLVDELRAAAPENFAAARRAVGDPPTLFTTGDLPMFTTAGFNPADLLHLPWIARPAAARASGPDASQIFDQFGAATLAIWTAAEQRFASDDGVFAYYKRVEAFAQAGANAFRETGA